MKRSLYPAVLFLLANTAKGITPSMPPFIPSSNPLFAPQPAPSARLEQSTFLMLQLLTQWIAADNRCVAFERVIVALESDLAEAKREADAVEARHAQTLKEAGDAHRGLANEIGRLTAANGDLESQIVIRQCNELALLNTIAQLRAEIEKRDRSLQIQAHWLQMVLIQNQLLRREEPSAAAAAAAAPEPEPELARETEREEGRSNASSSASPIGVSPVAMESETGPGDWDPAWDSFFDQGAASGQI